MVHGDPNTVGVEASSDWMFVVAAFRSDGDDSIVEFTVNGEPISLSTSKSMSSGPGMVVGAGAGDAFGGFKGAVKNVFVYDVALSSAEIRFLMTTAVSPPPAVVSGIWGYSFSQMNEGQQAFVSIDTSNLQEDQAPKTLSMRIAPTHSTANDFCIAQLVSQDRDEAVTIWSSYDPILTINSLRIRHERIRSSRRILDERSFPSLVIPTDNLWHSLVISWTHYHIFLQIDSANTVRHRCTTRYLIRLFTSLVDDLHAGCSDRDGVDGTGQRDPIRRV